MTPQEVLIKAAELIERDGWWNGKEPCEGRVCAAVAMLIAWEDIEWPDSTPAFTLGDVDRALTGYIGRRDIAGWNDAQPDGATVIAALRAAAQKVE